MVYIPYIVVLVLIVVTIIVKPKDKSAELHVFLLGLALFILGLVLSLWFDRDLLQVLILLDVWGPAKAVMVGYGILLGSIIRSIYKNIAK